MSNLTLDPKEIIREARKLEEQKREEQSLGMRSPRDCYRSASRKNRLLPVYSWEYLGRHDDESQGESEFTSTSTERPDEFDYKNLQIQDQKSYKLSEGIFADYPRPDVNEFSKFLKSMDARVASREMWTQVFAYTDFSAMPTYASILALAATAGEKQLSARQVFAERCRSTLRARGIAEDILECLAEDTSTESTVARYIDAAHMVACLEEQVATDGYLDAAIHFERIDDTRSALACVYRNARHRLRDNQFAELDKDIEKFDIGAAGINTMLAVLTVTAPIKSKLTKRNRLFRQIKAELKKRGLLEKGLLDGLK
ncbi:MAG: hypothetical protein GXP26_00800 [Planctomycetes bacterium]|nr:hypothetical protein [Planctomycetota bacterium]